MSQRSVIKDVIVNQRGDVDQFHDYSQRHMLITNAPGRSTSQQRQRRPQPLAGHAEHVMHVIANPGIEASHLFR
jgi:hypothetical protein